MQAWVILTGSVPSGTVDFLVGSGPADQGQPASDQPVTVDGPGTYAMPQPFRPTRPGEYAVSASFYNTSTIFVTIGGLPATSGLPYPHPSLVTTVTGSAPPPITAPTATLPGAPPCDPDMPGGDKAEMKPSTIFIGCATSADNLGHFTWLTWTATRATGTAIHGINNCKPSCAEGTFSYFPVTVVLSNPGNFRGFSVFQTLTMTPTSSVGRPETAGASPRYGPIWGWVPNG